MIKHYGLILMKIIEKYSLLYAAANENGNIHLTFDAVFMEALATDMAIWAVLGLVSCALFSYLVGSLNFAVIISKLFFHDDVRLYGSKNAGATNMLRTYGTVAGVATFIADAAKGAVAVLLSQLIMGQGGAYIAALFCILGHIFPVYYKFRGGKGVVVSAVAILCLEPIVFVCLLVLFIVIVASSKYISLGSIICAFFFPLLQYEFFHYGFLATVISVLIAAIVIIMHRSNIKRLLNREENKLSFKKKESK